MYIMGMTEDSISVYIYMLFIVISSYFINTLNHSVAVEQRYIYIYIRTLHISQVMMIVKNQHTQIQYSYTFACSTVQTSMDADASGNSTWYSTMGIQPPPQSSPPQNQTNGGHKALFVVVGG
jgi:hypothetical protein